MKEIELENKTVEVSENTDELKKISEIEDEELLNAIEAAYQKLTSKQLA